MAAQIACATSAAATVAIGVACQGPVAAQAVRFFLPQVARSILAVLAPVKIAGVAAQIGAYLGIATNFAAFGFEFVMATQNAFVQTFWAGLLVVELIVVAGGAETFNFGWFAIAVGAEHTISWETRTALITESGSLVYCSLGLGLSYLSLV